MQSLCGHLMPQPCPGAILDGGLDATVDNALALMREARILLLIGSGASAGYGIPIKLASSTETDPLVRYYPVRRAVLALGEDETGLYDDLRDLFALTQVRDEDLTVVSTNIDDLAKRAGLDELQLHGTTGRLQCARCDITWLSGADWPPCGCPTCGDAPIFNVPTNTLAEEDVVWRWMHADRKAATEFLDAPSGTPLTVLAIGIATHVHTLTPELQLLVERGLVTNVIWVNQEPASHGGKLVQGAARGPLEMLGDAGDTVKAMLHAAQKRL